MSFRKKIENFTCEHCGDENIGNGFTNHCKKCLWSKHVDVNPGDRKANCGGMMEPYEIYVKRGDYKITHKCLVCGFTRPSPISPADDFEEVIRIAKLIAKRKADLLR